MCEVRCKDRLSQLKKSGDVIGAGQGHIPTSFLLALCNWDLQDKLGGAFEMSSLSVNQVIHSPLQKTNK